VLRPFSLSRHARATTPAGPALGSGCSPESAGGGLPPMSVASAPTLEVSRSAQRSLAFGPACSRGRLATLSIEGFGSFVTSATAPIATCWSNSCQVGFAPTKERRLARRTDIAYLAAVQSNKTTCCPRVSFPLTARLQDFRGFARLNCRAADPTQAIPLNGRVSLIEPKMGEFNLRHLKQTLPLMCCVGRRWTGCRRRFV
jgi:hypothetical protein